MHAADCIKHKYILGSRRALGRESWEESTFQHTVKGGACPPSVPSGVLWRFQVWMETQTKVAFFSGWTVMSYMRYTDSSERLRGLKDRKAF